MYETVSSHVDAGMLILAFDAEKYQIAGPENIALQTPLTVVAQPTFQLGEIAARMLIDRIKNPNLPRQRIMLDAELIIRESCGYKKI